MFDIVKLDLDKQDELEKLKNFISGFSLKLDLVDESYVIYDQDKIIASCSRYYNVLKCFAIDPNYQAMGITNKLITVLLQHCFDLHIKDVFIFTKVVNARMFSSLNFEEIYYNKTMCLLHYGFNSINKVIEQIPKKNGINGAIVMNANPFTLGHQYLVEYASKHVNYLYVFVVEEDLSFFLFIDRFQLVKQGCEKFSNVIVLPSSIFIISSATFPTYFLKDQQLVVKEHARMDATIFAEYFSKALNIKYRFVGEEPLDVTTNMYNQVLKDVLKTYDIKLIEIKRKKHKDSVISASLVRKYLKNKDFVKIKEMVPETTYNFILAKYN
jgi:[citrate (pro-3S)-lyase] ligase